MIVAGLELTSTDLNTLFLEGAAGLRAGEIKFCTLANLDRP